MMTIAFVQCPVQVDGLGDGVLLEAPGQDLDFLRTTSFGMLQGCRMRNTKTVRHTTPHFPSHTLSLSALSPCIKCPCVPPLPLPLHMPSAPQFVCMVAACALKAWR